MILFNGQLEKGSMKTLLLMRHAKSSWDNAYLTDHERPLKKRGKIDAARIAKIIETKSLVPDLILSSTAKRAVQTVETLTDVLDYHNQILYLEDLYLADFEIYIDVLKKVDSDLQTVMIIAHNPGLEDYLMALTGEPEIMPTASLAHLELPTNRWENINIGTIGKLTDFFTPKTIP